METGKFEDLKGKVAVITGGGGLIGRSLSAALTGAGVNMAVTDISLASAQKAVADIMKDRNMKATGFECNVLDRGSLEKAKEAINNELGPIDILINCAGGNSPKATTQAEFVEKSTLSMLEKTFYGLEIDAFKKVFDLNFIGTVLPTMVFTPDMLKKGKGAVLNISSMNAFRPLTRIPAYSAAKASVNNFTEWLAVHLAKMNIRVNGIAPGFFLTDQNRFLLVDEENGGLTARGEKIIAGTPMGKFGNPEDLNGAALFLLSDAARFITGVTIPVDGGFNAYSGV